MDSFPSHTVLIFIKCLLRILIRGLKTCYAFKIFICVFKIIFTVGVSKLKKN